MPKTGTTLLQKRVFARHSEVFCLRQHIGPDDSTFNQPIYSLNRDPEEVFNVDATRFYYQDLCERAPEVRCLLLSWEDLAQTKAGIGFEEKARRLRSVFDDGPVHIIVVVRHPVDMARSIYFQWLRQAFKPGKQVRYVEMNEWIKRALSRDRFGGLQNTLQHEVIQAYAKWFGSRSIHVFIYERLKRDKTAFAAELSDLLGINATQTTELLGEDVVHRSLNLRQVETLKYFRSSESGQRDFCNIVEDYTEVLPETLAKSVRQNYALKEPEDRELAFGQLVESINPYLQGGEDYSAQIDPQLAKVICDATAGGLGWIEDEYRVPLRQFGYPVERR